MRKLVALAFVASLGSAYAQITYGGGAGGSIPDNDPAGFSSSIVVGTAGTIASFNWVEIQGATHTWVGDVSASITNGFVTVDLFRRPAYTGSGFGDSSDLGGTYRFLATGASFTQAAIDAGSGAAIPPGEYARETNTLAAGFNNTTYADFVGASMAGTWTLNIADAAGGDTGAIEGWSMNITPVPEPGTMIALGAGIAGVLARRRRKAA